MSYELQQYFNIWPASVIMLASQPLIELMTELILPPIAQGSLATITLEWCCDQD